MENLFNWTLRKGEVITQAQIEAEFGFRHEDDPNAYQCKLMGLGKTIADHMKSIGQPASIRMCNHGIQILDNYEALEHEQKRGRQGRAKMINAFNRLKSNVDVNQLSEDGRRAHDRAVLVEGAYVQAIQDTRRRLRGGGHLQNNIPRDPYPEQPPRRM